MLEGPTELEKLHSYLYKNISLHLSLFTQQANAKASKTDMIKVRPHDGESAAILVHTDVSSLTSLVAHFCQVLCFAH